MGTDVTEVVEAIPPPRAIKVHRIMCTNLMKLVERVEKIFPEIEAARPRCSSGIQALCLLNSAIEKAKLLLQYCSESSKLYLALTGDAILLRCKKSRNLLEQSLSQIQNMVPVLLAAQISQTIADLRAATFSLDPSEEEAGKAVKTLFQQYASARDSREESASEAIQFAASRLHITSQKALLIEKRSIKNLIGRVSDGEQKKQILLFLLLILKKYEKSIVKGQTENHSIQHEDSFDKPVQTNSQLENTVNEAQSQSDILSRPMPPEEFKCPLSLRLMYDPVVIDSGQTFERMWIQKWFDEGQYTCPKTKRKLAHLSLTPNTVMKDLILKWCVLYGVTVTDPHTQLAKSNSWENSSTSVASLSSSMNDLCIPVDLSNVSLGSLDSSRGKITDEDFHRTRSNSMEILQKLDGLPWESQCKVIEDLNIFLKRDEEDCRVMTSENFVEPLFRFLNNAVDLCDVKAQRSGCGLLLVFVSKCRNSIPNLHEDAFALLASFLDSQVTEEALAIMEILSCFSHCRSKIVESGALTYIINMLEKERRNFQESTIKILYNLSSNSAICSLIASSDLVPKFVPFLEDIDLSRYCVGILSKLCEHESARISVVETDGCVASVVKILENDSCEEQEHAVSILLSLCSQRDQYCQLIMNEGVVPALVSISVNGNERGKMLAMELLRLLRDIEYDDDVQESPVPNIIDSPRDNGDQCKEKKSSSRARGLLGKMSIFSKTSSLAPRKKR
ncbi:hypothetical protein LguiB_019150 [Lonicera macranthoides]